MTQAEMVLQYIKDFGSITAKEAFLDLGIYRLSACIYVLRNRGIKIRTNIEESRNRYGKTVKYARYTLAGE